ncbi:arginase family protein [Halotalea alkalilenta]|uniref:arginase family protein n=1 Tax=Halotalea alkalilenta TaxID=376489 RepID=UPI00048073E9|nr:arginase family protein [Halotalea alkalilenta]
MSPELLLFQSATADRNPLGIEGAALLAQELSSRLELPLTRIGEPGPPLDGDWKRQLACAQPMLMRLATELSAVMARNGLPIALLPRCAAGIATLPVITRHRPDAALVWLDAHGDLNTPQDSASGYLGGMVVAAAVGRWDSGLGGGWPLGQVILAGARELDPAEYALVDTGAPGLVPPGPDFVARLLATLGDTPCYLHLDCDVLEPGQVPTEYAVPGGLELSQLGELATRLASRDSVVGIQIAEFQARWSQDGPPVDPTALIEALSPLFDAR